MKLLYVTDLHGIVRKYNRLLKIAQEVKADIVINGGDMLPKKMEISLGSRAILLMVFFQNTL